MVTVMHVQQVANDVSPQRFSPNQPMSANHTLYITVSNGRKAKRCRVSNCRLFQQEKMQSAKEKISNMGSAAKEKADIYKAKVEEKVEKGTARTHEEKRVAEERRKAKEAEAKMELHEAKATHAAERMHGHLHGGYVEPAPLGHGGNVPQGQGYVGPMQTERVVDPALHGTTAPTTYPPSGGHRPGHIL